MKKQSKTIIIIFIVAIAIILIFYFQNIKINKLQIGEKQEGETCNSSIECKSGVCGYVGREQKCAPEQCSYGATYGWNDYFCNKEGKWQRVRKVNESCNENFECDTFLCDSESHLCIEHTQFCEKKGLKSIVFNCDRSPMASEAAILDCSDCGNSICDEPSEKKCNCPEDCI